MKQSKPWYRASKNAWYVEHKLKQVRLGEHPESAPPPKRNKTGWNAPQSILDAYHKLMATDPTANANASRSQGSMTVAVLADLFLDYSQLHNTPACYENYKYFLQSFCNAKGRSLAADIKLYDVTLWLDRNKGWKGARRHAIIGVKRLFSWADQQGLLSPSPLRNLKAGRPNRRTRVLSSDEQSQILAAIQDEPFRQFVRALFLTGCRPSEVARVSAENVHLNQGTWVFTQHKTSAKTHRPRIVFLCPEMVELTKTLMQKFPAGPLFRSFRNQMPYTKNAIICRFRRLREALPHLKYFVAYSTRHSFATNALVNGVGIAEVAQMLGHTSTELVSSTYGHLADQVSHMREAAKKAVG